MYLHGGRFCIGATLILQAPAGTKLSSGQNRVTGSPEAHMIRGAILYECRRLPNNSRPRLGTIHPLIRALQVGSLQLSDPYTKYSLRVGGCDAAGQFVSAPDVFDPLLLEAYELNTKHNYNY